MNDFTPRLGGYGGRIERDRVFGGSSAEQEDPSTAQEGPVAMDDDDDISWAELVEKELEVESTYELSVAFD